MVFSPSRRVWIQKCFMSANTHLNALLKLKRDRGDDAFDMSIKGADISTAIYLNALNGNKEKANHILSKFVEFSQELLEDIIEKRHIYECKLMVPETGNPIDKRESKIMKDMKKDGQYKEMCDYLMNEKKHYELIINLM